MTGTNCDLFTHKSSQSYLNHLVFEIVHVFPTYPSSSTTIAPNRNCTLIAVLLLEPAEEVKRQNGYAMRVFTKLSFLRTMSHYC
jgi:hypothetical protein